MNIETLTTLGYYISSLSFMIATIITWSVVRKFGKSALGSIFSYIFIGTSVFFVITIFQKLGADFFSISTGSVDIWWHIMFYLAMFSYYFAFKAMVGLGSGEDNSGVIGAEKKWAIFSSIILILIFLIPNSVEPIIKLYSDSRFSELGLHHFLAFILSGVIGSYLLNTRKNLGQIGRIISSPMIVAIWAFAIQHFWELLVESWKVVDVTSANIEGVEKTFLIIASVSIIYASIRLGEFAKSK